MGPQLSENHRSSDLQRLGEACVNIVHDLKNQLGGLKLYATFLRKRLSASDIGEEERQTLEKIIQGLDRTARDLSSLSEYGRPTELRSRTEVDLSGIIGGLQSVKTDDSLVRTDLESCEGRFDQVALSQAFESITSFALESLDKKQQLTIELRRQEDGDSKFALIRWSPASLPESDLRLAQNGASLRFAIAGKIIRAHSGDVFDVNKGVNVILPLSQIDAQAN